MQKGIMAGGVAVALAASLSLGAGDARMQITSSAFGHGADIPAKFTCDGADINPPLQFVGVPVGTKSLALIVDDADAPGGVFTHWMVWNISPRTNAIGEGSAPGGLQGRNDFGKLGYGGPCPPSGAHRYFFRVFALDRELDLPAGARRAQLDAAMKGHVIAQGELVGRYSARKR